MTSVALIVEYVSTILSLLCLPINIWFVYIIFRERHRAPFSAPFFRLCIHLSVADILMTVFSTIFFKLPLFGFLPQALFKSNWSALPIAGVNYLGHSQAVGIIFIAINRFTAVFFPIRHKHSWWKPKVTTCLLLAQWTLPLLFVLPLFLTEFTFTLDRKSGSVLFTARDPQFHMGYFLAMAILDGVFINVIVSALYIAIFVRVKTHVHVKKPGELAMRLALSAFIIFISYLCLGIFSVLSALSKPRDAWMYRTLWFVVNDVLCASNAPVLLALNRPIRKVFLKTIEMNGNSLHNKNSLLNHL